MSDVKAIGGFEFYETLRYLLPGVLLVFLFGYISFPEYWNRFVFSEKLVFGILAGFLIQSFGMYKWIPGSTRIRKEFHRKANRLTGIDDIYLRWDMILLTINIDERQYFRKYFALGAFKLDIVFVLSVFLIYHVFNIIIDIVYASILEINSILILFCSLVVIYVVRDDGLNDLKRAFDILLMIFLEYRQSGEMESKINLINKNKELFIDYRRKFLHPLDVVKSLITFIPKRIRNELGFKRKDE